MLDPEDRDVLTYVTTDYGHVRVKQITKEEGIKLVKDAGLWDRCGVTDSYGPTIINKFAARFDKENNLWVYNHDGIYWITRPYTGD